MGLSGTQAYPSAKRRLRLGIVGGGGTALVGQWHWTGVRLSNRWDLVAGALSSDPERAQAFGRDWFLPQDRIYSDFKNMAQVEAAREDGIDAVSICTPNWTHFPIAMAFMEAGINVICDKPMTLTNQEAHSLAQKAQETGVYFAVTHPYVFHPMVRQMREMVANGALGSVRQVLVEYAQDWGTEPDDPDNRTIAWRRDPAKVGRTSATGDIGTHALQLLEYTTGLKAAKLRADFHICGAEKAMEDTAFINLKMENGAPGMMWVTQAAPGNYCGLRLRVYGEKGGVQWDQEFPETIKYTPLNMPEQTIVRGHGAGVVPAAERMVTLPRGHGESLSDAWGNLYREIAIAIDAHQSGTVISDDLLAVPTVETGVRGVQFMNAAADSHEAGGVWVDF